MDKVRVYELARDLEMTSPETIELLKKKLKIRVKSASSTIEEDTAIKLKRLLRLESAGTRRRKKPAPAVSDGAAATGAPSGGAASLRKRRAEKARAALLAEMEAEEEAKRRAKAEKEENARKAREAEAARVAREEEARREAEEAERLAEAEAAALAALRAIGTETESEVETQAEGESQPAAEVESGAEADVPAAAALDSAAATSDTSEVVAAGPSGEAAPSDPPTAAAEAAASASASLSESEAAAPATREASPSSAAAEPAEGKAAAQAGEAPAPAAKSDTDRPARPARPEAPKPFVPGPTSQFIRPRPAPPPRPRREDMKPVPPPPRPAAPIKTVRARGPEPPRPVGKPKRKQKKGTAGGRSGPTRDVMEPSLPEPTLRADDRRGAEPPKVYRKVTLTEGVTVKELAEKLEVKHKDVIKILLGRGVLATINQTLDAETATEVAKAFGAEAEILSFEEDIVREETVEEKPEDLSARAPVVTVMGHVDHGKTSLLDAIRQTKVVEKEAGGITQHVGAYSVQANGRSVVFLDTPGHEAFTMMRARGARVTDLVVLVVAADDGVMPQTREAIDHARAAGVPLVVAINKIDKPNANPDRVKQQLADLELVPEDWGGSTVFCQVSAKKREGLDLLIEMILLVADLLELKANPSRAGMGTVLEAKLDKGRGSVAHVLVQNGTISVGDSFVAGAVYGKVRALFDDRGHKIKDAGPSSAIEILGLASLPQAGDQFQVFPDTAKARQISEFRQLKLRERDLASSARLTLDALHAKVQEGTVKELPIVLKADVQGSVEVLKDTLKKLSTDKVKVRIIHAGAGAITDTDVLLASASNAVVIGFNVRPERSAVDLADKEGIDIRLHTVIYNITDELKKAMEGMLEPTYKEVTLGRAEVRDTFKVPKVGTIAGCYVVDGKVTRNAEIRLLRDNVVIFEGKLGSLRRFKDDVGEVKDGFECGIGLAGYNDVKVGDVIEAYVMEKVQPQTT